MSESRRAAKTTATKNPDEVTDPFLRRYKILEKIGEGSYSEVVKCKSRETGHLAACKRLKHVYRSWSQISEIAEIATLRHLPRHPNILNLFEITFDQLSGKVSLVFELMDMNLYELIKDRKRLLTEVRVRSFLFQIMRALRHLHKCGLFHRDIKPENILIKPKTDFLKLADLGSVRGVESNQPYTEYISTRWYRSPECLLTAGYYSAKMDIWAVGCVFYEILTLRPLFPGSSELDQIGKIHNVFGPPSPKLLQKFFKHAEREQDTYVSSSKQARRESIAKVLQDLKTKTKNLDMYFGGASTGIDKLLPVHISPEAKELLRSLLQYDPDVRPAAHRVLQHHYFKDLREGVLVNTDKLALPNVVIVGNDLIPRDTKEVFQDSNTNLRILGERRHREVNNEKIKKYQVAPYIPRMWDLQWSDVTDYKRHRDRESRKKTSEATPDISVVKAPTPSEANANNNATASTNATLVTRKSVKVSLSSENIEKLPKIAKLSEEEAQVLSKLKQDYIQMKQAVKKMPTKHPSQSLLDSSDSIERPKDGEKNNNAQAKATSMNVINHKLGPEDLKKINAARQLVKMDPIQAEEKSMDEKSPRKGVEGLSKIPQFVAPLKTKLSSIKMQTPSRSNMGGYSVKHDKSLMHVPPAVAAAAMKYSSHSTAYSRAQAHEEGSQIARTNFLKTKSKDVYEAEKPETPPQESEREKQKKLLKIIHEDATIENEIELKLQKKAVARAPRIPVLVPQLRSSSYVKNHSFTAKTSKGESLAKPVNSILLHKNSKRKEDTKETPMSVYLKKPIESPYYKYATLEETIRKSKPAKSFPRNRFFLEPDTPSPKHTSQVALNRLYPDVNANTPVAETDRGRKNAPTGDQISPIQKYSKIPTEVGKKSTPRKSKSRTNFVSYGELDHTLKSKQKLSYIPQASLQNGSKIVANSRPGSGSKNASVVQSKYTKLTSEMDTKISERPPSRLRRDFFEMKKSSNHYSVEKKEDVASKKPSVLRKREKVQQPVRDDVFCSSDDDVLISMRKKIDALISERARRISEYANKERHSKKIAESEYEEDVLAYRARHEPPRKLHKKESQSRSHQSTHRRGPESKYYASPYNIVHPKNQPLSRIENTSKVHYMGSSSRLMQGAGPSTSSKGVMYSPTSKSSPYASFKTMERDPLEPKLKPHQHQSRTVSKLSMQNSKHDVKYHR